MAAWFSERRRDFKHLAEYEGELDHLDAWSKHADARSWPEHARLLWLQAYPPFHRGDYRHSREWLERADAALDPNQDAELTANIRSDLGIILGQLGQFREALKLLEQSLEIRRKVLGPEHPDTAASLSNTGGYYRDLGEFRRALELQGQALEIRRKVLGPEHPDTAASLSNVGSCHRELGEPRRGLALIEQALEIQRKVLGAEHPDTAMSLNNLGVSYGKLSDRRRALELQEQALEIQRKVLGPEHPNTAQALNNVGVSYGTLGDRRRALALLQQALEIQRKVLGPEHPNTATSWRNIGYLHAGQGDHAEAARCYELAHTIFRERLSEHAESTIEALAGWARSLAARGQKHKAHERVVRCLRSLPRDHRRYKELTALRDELVPDGFRKQGRGKAVTGKGRKPPPGRGTPGKPRSRG